MFLTIMIRTQSVSDIVDCRQLTQAGNYSHGYAGAKGNKEDTYKECMSEIDLVYYLDCTLLVTIEVQCYNSTYLPHGHHLAESASQPESSTKPKSEDYARDQYHTNHGDAQPTGQIMALSAASGGMVCP